MIERVHRFFYMGPIEETEGFNTGALKESDNSRKQKTFASLPILIHTENYYASIC